VKEIAIRFGLWVGPVGLVLLVLIFVGALATFVVLLPLLLLCVWAGRRLNESAAHGARLRDAEAMLPEMLYGQAVHDRRAAEARSYREDMDRAMMLHASERNRRAHAAT
jgi:hypothetical protein